MNTIFEPLKFDIFEKSLFIQNNNFFLLFSSEIKYEDYGYEYINKSIIYIQLQNNIYSFRLFRKNDEQLIAELNLEIKENLVYLLSYQLKSNFRTDRNTRIQSTNNLKFLTVFFLSFMQANSKELFFGAIIKKIKLNLIISDFKSKYIKKFRLLGIYSGVIGSTRLPTVALGKCWYRNILLEILNNPSNGKINYHKPIENKYYNLLYSEMNGNIIIIKLVT